jgi:hypothetical protein
VTVWQLAQGGLWSPIEPLTINKTHTPDQWALPPFTVFPPQNKHGT